MVTAEVTVKGRCSLTPTMTPLRSKYKTEVTLYFVSYTLKI